MVGQEDQRCTHATVRLDYIPDLFNKDAGFYWDEKVTQNQSRCSGSLQFSSACRASNEVGALALCHGSVPKGWGPSTSEKLLLLCPSALLYSRLNS